MRLPVPGPSPDSNYRMIGSPHRRATTVSHAAARSHPGGRASSPAWTVRLGARERGRGQLSRWTRRRVGAGWRTPPRRDTRARSPGGRCVRSPRRSAATRISASEGRVGRLDLRSVPASRRVISSLLGDPVPLTGNDAPGPRGDGGDCEEAGNDQHREDAAGRRAASRHTLPARAGSPGGGRSVAGAGVPNSASMRRSRLYLAVRSLRAGALRP